jgi:hypothetical protein
MTLTVPLLGIRGNELAVSNSFICGLFNGGVIMSDYVASTYLYFERDPGSKPTVSINLHLSKFCHYYNPCPKGRTESRPEKRHVRHRLAIAQHKRSVMYQPLSQTLTA